MKSEEFTTRDFYLACFLKAREVKLTGMEKRGSIVIFSFEDTRGLQEMITRFYNDQEVVSANRFVNAIRDLKALVHNTQAR